jgi:hypothetical protein
MRQRELAAQYRRESRAGCADGLDRLRWAGVCDHLCEFILANLDALYYPLSRLGQRARAKALSLVWGGTRRLIFCA